MGDTPSAPDYMALYTLPLVQDVALKTYDWDILSDIEGGRDLLAAFNKNEHAPTLQRPKPRRNGRVFWRDSMPTKRSVHSIDGDNACSASASTA